MTNFNTDDFVMYYEKLTGDITKAITGKQYDSSWIRPLTLTKKQRMECLDTAETLLQTLKKELKKILFPKEEL